MRLFLHFSNGAFKLVTSKHVRYLLLNLARVETYGLAKDLGVDGGCGHGLQWPNKIYYEIYYDPEISSLISELL